MTITIPPAAEGRLLRSYLKFTLGLSSGALARLKNHPQGILVNGQRVTVRYTLHAGDLLTLSEADTAETATETVIPTALPVDILYEDDHVIALAKPPHMPTHPSHGHLTDTLANALAYRYLQAGEPFVFRPLGRLDRNTSGVVIVGKSRAASGCLGNALKEGRVTKRYLAILDGELPSNGRVCAIRTFMYRPEASGIRRAVCSEETQGAEDSLTLYRVLATARGKTLVLAEPKTGRTHQLRVHFSHLGHPILGDEIYGSPSSEIDRHALHALSISVPLPFAEVLAPHQQATDAACGLNCPDDNGYLHTWAPLPQDMQSIIDAYFPHALPPLPTQDIVKALSLH